jgi:hypothetical protein
MKPMLRRCLALTFAAAGLLGCVEKGEVIPSSTRQGDTAKIRESPALSPPQHVFEQRLLEIARSYESYERVRANYGWAPELCAPIASSAFLPRLNLSESTDSATHGRKIYALFAKETSAGAYYETDKPNRVGQVVVKEAWVPEEVQDTGQTLTPVSRKIAVKEGDKETVREDSYVPYARSSGHLYHAKEKAALFVMYKLPPETAGTDQGWVYGTLTPDGKTVTSAGRIESCMRCHRDAPYDRLFGVPAVEK